MRSVGSVSTPQTPQDSGNDQPWSKPISPPPPSSEKNTGLARPTMTGPTLIGGVEVTSMEPSVVRSHIISLLARSDSLRQLPVKNRRCLAITSRKCVEIGKGVTRYTAGVLA